MRFHESGKHPIQPQNQKRCAWTRFALAHSISLFTPDHRVATRHQHHHITQTPESLFPPMGPPLKSKPRAFKDALVLEHLVSFVFRNGRSLRLRHRPGGSGHAGYKRNKVRHGPGKALGSWSGWKPESVHKEVWFASCNRYLSAIWVGQGGRDPVWWERAMVAPLQARGKLRKQFFHSRWL
jgi:hypothetical protein